MLHTGNTLTKKAAFKALEQFSSYHPNGEVLVEAGIADIMVEEIFTWKIHDEAMNSRKEAAAILGNLLESGIEFENLQVKYSWSYHGVRLHCVQHHPYAQKLNPRRSQH